MRVVFGTIKQGRLAPDRPVELVHFLHRRPGVYLYYPVFHEGARVKSRVTPLIDNNKLTHLLDEQQVYQHYKSIHQIRSVQRV
jgi:hypothetical protein